MATELQIEYSLKELHELKAALSEHAIVAITNPQGKITYFNGTFCASPKYSREALLVWNQGIINSENHPFAKLGRQRLNRRLVDMLLLVREDLGDLAGANGGRPIQIRTGDLHSCRGIHRWKEQTYD